MREADSPSNAEPARPRGTMREVLFAFLKLGSIAFGGPAAHLGLYRLEFVTRRRWLDQSTFTDLVALCQFLPGPASSQVAFSIGVLRAGYLGGLAAWCGFMLPSALLMLWFAQGVARWHGPRWEGLQHGLKLVAVAVVAQAVWGMARTACSDRVRTGIAAAAAVIALGFASSTAQLGAIVLGGLAGWAWCRRTAAPVAQSLAFPVSRTVGWGALGVFAVLLTGLPLLRDACRSPALVYAAAFYRSGALVFGGGHVVLPLLQQAVVTPGWVREDVFLAGYGATQAMPGPIFTFGAYVGAVLLPALAGIPGAALGLAALFMPGMLLLLGVLPVWDSLRRRQSAQAAMGGVAAAVAGLLGAVLYTPLGTGTVKSGGDVGVVLVAWVLLTVWRLPPVSIVILGALVGMALA